MVSLKLERKVLSNYKPITMCDHKVRFGDNLNSGVLSLKGIGYHFNFPMLSNVWMPIDTTVAFGTTACTMSLKLLQRSNTCNVHSNNFFCCTRMYLYGCYEDDGVSMAATLVIRVQLSNYNVVRKALLKFPLFSFFFCLRRLRASSATTAWCHCVHDQ